MKKYAFVLMGNYDPARDKAEFTHGESLTRICTVRSFAQAEQTVEALWKEASARWKCAAPSGRTVPAAWQS